MTGIHGVDAPDEIVADWFYLGPHLDDYRGVGRQNGASAADGSGQFQATVSRPVVLTIPGMDRVKVRHDIIYKQDGGISLTMDVYTPPDLTAGSPRPAVIFIHGGLPAALASMKPKDWGIYQSYGRLVAASGWESLSTIGWISRNPIRTAASDVTHLIDYVRQHGAELGVDKIASASRPTPPGPCFHLG